jgi:hypothetical protein
VVVEVDIAVPTASKKDAGVELRRITEGETDTQRAGVMLALLRLLEAKHYSNFVLYYSN